MYDYIHNNFNLWTIAIVAFTVSTFTCTLIWLQRNKVYSFIQGVFPTQSDCTKFYLFHSANSTTFILIPVYFLTGNTIGFIEDWVNCAVMLFFALLMCIWMKSNYHVNTLTFSGQLLGFSKKRNIHLSHVFLAELKQNRSADYLIERLLNSGIPEISTCFKELQPSSMSLITHHIGKIERFNLVRNAFVQNGYSVSELKVSWLEKNSLRFILAIYMKKPKALCFKIRGMKITLAPES